MGDGEKLLTHLNSALKVLLGLDIFPRVPKKKLNFVDQCNLCSSPKIVRVKKNKKIKGGHVTLLGYRRGGYRVLVGGSLGKEATWKNQT